MHDDPIAITRGSSPAALSTALVGLLLLFYGVGALLFGGDSFETDAMAGTVDGERWLGGIEGNGWTNLFILAGGLLLILSSPVDALAQLMALLVGVAFSVAAIIAFVDGDDMLGIAATNRRTALAFALIAGLLVVVGLMRTHRRPPARDTRRFGGRPDATPGASDAPASWRRRRHAAS